MAAASLAHRPHSTQPLCWLRGAAYAAFGWAFVGLTVPLIADLPDLHGALYALLLTAVVLCTGARLGLTALAANAVRERR